MWLIIGLLFILYALWMVAAVLDILNALKVRKLLKNTEITVECYKGNDTEHEDDYKQEVTQNE